MSKIADTIVDTIAFKERDPVSTIKLCKRLLEEIGFNIEEIEDDTGVSVYSSHVSIFYRGKYITTTHGKGNTRELSLASAYGEMMETLQCLHQHIYPEIDTLYNKDILELDKFVLYPCEKREFSVDKHKEDSVVLNLIDELTVGRSENKDLVERYISMIHKSYGYIPLQEYRDAITEDKLYVNELLIRYIIAPSTGLCAGNSKYEAMLQGLCEIVERYSRFVAYRDNLTFPLIPEEEIKKCEHAYKVYSQINSTGRFKIEFRDASLGKEMPVVCAIIYDKVRRGYKVSFGAFPIMRVALDRAVNELIQGENIQNLGMVGYWGYNNFNIPPLSKRLENAGFTEDDIRDAYWIVTNISSNKGAYKDKFLGDKYSYEFKPWHDIKEISSEYMFKDLVRKIKDKFGDTVIYKEYSYLGFETFSVISPRLLIEPVMATNLLCYRGVIDREKVEEYIFKGEINVDGIKELDYKDMELPLGYVIGRKLKYNLSTDFIQGYIELIKRNYAQASYYFSKDVPSPSLNIPEGIRFELMDYWGVFINYIALKDSVSDEEEISNILTKIFDKRIVDDIREILKDEIEITKALFLDRYSKLCVVDWESHEISVEIIKMLNNKKLEYESRKREVNG